MRRFWDAVVTVIVVWLVISVMAEMLRPYAPYMALAVVVGLLLQVGYRRYRRW